MRTLLLALTLSVALVVPAAAAPKGGGNAPYYICADTYGVEQPQTFATNGEVKQFLKANPDWVCYRIK